MILLDNLIQSSEFKVDRFQTAEVDYCNGKIPVYYYQWSPIKKPGSRHKVLLPFYTITHEENKTVHLELSEICTMPLYEGTKAGKGSYDIKSYPAEFTIYAQLQYIMRIQLWYKHNPDYASKQLITYLNHVLASYSEFFKPQTYWKNRKK